MISFLKAFVIGCHVSLWHFLIKRNGVKKKHVLFSCGITLLAYGVYNSILAHSVNILALKIVFIFFSFIFFVIGGIMTLVILITFFAKIYELIPTTPFENKKSSDDDELLHSAFLRQFFLGSFRSIIFFLLLAILFVITRPDMKFNEVATIVISIILANTMSVFTMIGYVLLDKDPPKKKKEEDKEMGDFSLNGA